MNNRIAYRPGLDGLRAVAVLSVMCSHLHVWPFRAGGVGVDVFFVISGYLITSLLLAEIDHTGRVSFGNFYRRRAARLLPALALVLIACLLVASASPFPDVRSGTTAAVIATGLYVANWFSAAGHNLGFLGHTWSLAVEEQFYLVWPLALLGLLALLKDRRRAMWALVGLTAVIGVYRLVSPWGWWRIYVGFDTHCDGLLLGCAIALGLRFSRRLLWPAVAVLALIAVHPGALSHRVSGSLELSAAALASAVIVPLVAEQPGAMAWRPLIAIGKRSYGLYLWHYVLLEALKFRRLPAEGVVPAAFVFAASFAIAFGSYRYLEVPVRRALTGTSNRHIPASPALAT